MNEYSKELCHWGIELGAKRDNHKYIARVETRPGKYLYFYDMAKYNAWKTGTKNKVQGIGKNIKNKAEEIKRRVTPTVNEARSKTNSLTRSVAAKTVAQKVKAEKAVEKYSKYISNRLSSTARNVKDTTERNINVGKTAALNAASAAQEKAKERARVIKDRYDAGKKKILSNANDVTNRVSSLSKKAISTGRSMALDAKTDITSRSSKVINDAKDFIKKKSNALYKGENESLDILEAKNYASHFLKSFMERIGEGSYNILHRRAKQPMSASVTKAPSGSNYLAEVSYPDGTKVKIKDKKQWEHFAETVKYQQNEQSFMHSIPEIKLRPDGTMPSREEDSAEVNDKRADNDSKFRSVNCIYCSTAYELRRRGYDVEAADLPSTVTATNISQLYEMEDSEIERKTIKLTTNEPMSTAGLYATVTSSSTVEKDGKTKYVYSVDYSTLKNNDDRIKSFSMINTMGSARNKASKDFPKQAREQIDKTAKDFPNGSRGMINVYWQFGGGHSMVWEKDEKGKVTIYDTQTNRKLDTAEMMESVDPFAPIMMIRTDDAKLSKKALSKIRSN